MSKLQKTKRILTALLPLFRPSWWKKNWQRVAWRFSLAILAFFICFRFIPVPFSAYNAGASRVEKWLARSNGKLAMDEFIASIPFFETRGYVQNVLTYDFYYQNLQNKEKLQTFSKEEYDRLY